MSESGKGLLRRVKQHVKAERHKLFAIFQPGFEDAAKSELLTLGDYEFETFEGGVEFEGTIDDIYKINLSSQCITRLLLRLTAFRAENWDRLYKKISEFPWELYLRKDAPLEFSIKCRHSRLYHTGRIEEEARRAISDSLAKGYSLPSDGTVQKIFIRFEDDVCRISLDASGEPLYKRGYKTHTTAAPLRETLASLILKGADAFSYDLIFDPMCGSGTFVAESAIARDGVLPGGEREFPFIGWPVYSEASYNFLKKSLSESVKRYSFEIFGSDIDEKALSAALENLSHLKLVRQVNLVQKDFFETERCDLPDGKLMIVMNPPYGERIYNEKKAGSIYRRIGEKIKADFPDSAYAIIVYGIENEKVLSLPYDRKILFMNGGLRVSLVIKN